MNKTKILCGQLNCSVKLANVSTRCSSHPQGTFTLRMTRASIGKLVKLSATNLHFIHADCNRFKVRAAAGMRTVLMIDICTAEYVFHS